MSEDDHTKIARLEEKLAASDRSLSKIEAAVDKRITKLEGHWSKGAWAVVGLVAKGIYDFIKDGG